MPYRYENYGSLGVAWTHALKGGGRDAGQQFVPVVLKRIGKVNRVCEACAGPGFVGFSLLAHGLCDSLCLCVVNAAAIDVVEHSIAINGLQDRVSVYLSDALEGIPEQEQWDLVVVQPPHSMGLPSLTPAQSETGALPSYDPDWNIHRRIYAKVRQHLKPHGQCVMLENYLGSSEETFLPMLEGTGMEFAGSFMVTDGISDFPVNTMYFFCTRVRHEEFVSIDVPPARDLELQCDAAGRTILRHGTDSQPLTLSLGQRYAISVSGAPVPLELRSADPPCHIRMALPVPSPRSDQPNPRRIMAIPTIPCQIADAHSGNELIRFA